MSATLAKDMRARPCVLGSSVTAIAYPRCPAAAGCHDSSSRALDTSSAASAPLDPSAAPPAPGDDEGVAAFRANDAAPLPRGQNHQGVDLGLPERRGAGSIADEDPRGVSREPQHALVDQGVVKHQVRRAE